MSYNPTRYEVLIKQYVRSILDISENKYSICNITTSCIVMLDDHRNLELLFTLVFFYPAETSILLLNLILKWVMWREFCNVATNCIAILVNYGN